MTTLSNFANLCSSVLRTPYGVWYGVASPVQQRGSAKPVESLLATLAWPAESRNQPPHPMGQYRGSPSDTETPPFSAGETNSETGCAYAHFQLSASRISPLLSSPLLSIQITLESRRRRQIALLSVKGTEYSTPIVQHERRIRSHYSVASAACGAQREISIRHGVFQNDPQCMFDKRSMLTSRLTGYISIVPVLRKVRSRCFSFGSHLIIVLRTTPAPAE